MPWAAIATWKFGLSAAMRAGEILSCMGSSLNAVEEAIKGVEADPEVDSVGFGALPNWEGEVELDAAIMDGRDLSIGAVAGLKGCLHPISIARQVMRTLPHNLLVREGALKFASCHGFERATLITDKARRVWEERRREALEGKSYLTGHDTVGVIAVDANGDMACGTSTSGTAMKHEGRVGDSPLVGSGFYVDNEVGGAATNLERFEFAVATETSAPALQCVRGIDPVKNPSSL